MDSNPYGKPVSGTRRPPTPVKIVIAGGFGLIWPAVRNFYTYRGGTSWQSVRAGTGPRAFIDPNQAPRKKA